MAKKEKRFIKVHEEGNGLSTATHIYVDANTGVNYLFMQSGYAGGLTPLLDREGKVVVTRVPQDEDKYL